MKVSILSNGKITTKQYSNVAIDGEVSEIGGGGIGVETDPIFTSWKINTGSKLVADVSTLSEEVATVASELELKADKADIPEIPDLSGYATTDSVTAGLDTKANVSDVYTKSEIDATIDTTIDTLENSLNTKLSITAEGLEESLATKASIDSVTTLNNTVSANTDAIDALEADIATKADATSVYTKSEVDATIGAKADKSAVESNAACITALGNSITVLGCTVVTKADQNVVDANTACISSLSTTITELNTCVTTLDNTVSTLSTEVNEVSDGLATKANASDVTAGLATKADADNVYTKSEVDTTLESYAKTEDLPEMPDLSGYATTESVTAGLATKADVSSVYTKTQVDEAIGAKADKSAVDANTADITKLTTCVTTLGNNIVTKADSTTVTALSGTVTELCNQTTCALELAGSAYEQASCIWGILDNYGFMGCVSIPSFYTSSIYPNDWGSGITIDGYTHFLDNVGFSGDATFSGAIYALCASSYFMNIYTNSVCPSDFDEPLNINAYSNINIEGSSSINLTTPCSVCISSTKTSIDSEISLVGCTYNSASWNTGEAHIVRWIEAPDGCVGYVPVFDVIASN